VELCPQSITPRQSYETFEYNLPIQNWSLTPRCN
jgi:hypothetical protein